MNATKELDLDHGGGDVDWLYRQGELVLGPIPEKQIVEKLYTGDVDGRTEMCPIGHTEFRPLLDISQFKIHLAKAEAKRRVDASARIEKQKGARKRNFTFLVVGLVALVLAVASAMGARYLAVHNPFKRVDYSQISVEPPVIALARARKRDEELVDYPGGGGRRNRGAIAARMPGSSAGSAGRVAGGTEEDADGMQMAKFDRSGIQAVVASKQRTLYSCFGEEAQRRPGLTGKFPIEFVIGNDGHVSKLWVDHPEYRQGPLNDCLFRELQKWPFRPYEGEQATVGLSFNVGSKG